MSCRLHKTIRFMGTSANPDDGAVTVFGMHGDDHYSTKRRVRRDPLLVAMRLCRKAKRTSNGVPIVRMCIRGHHRSMHWRIISVSCGATWSGT